MKLGSWNVNVATSAMPQKVATAVADLNNMVGAEYRSIAYLGSQTVNGTNHAVLAEQTLVSGKDVKNIVVVIFRETPEGITLSSIERVVESGGELGGMAVIGTVEIPEEAQKAFDEVFDGYVGAKIVPFALLATQMTKGINYVFATEVTPVTADPEKRACLVIINPITKDVSFVDMLTSKQEVMSLGYAFTWLRSQNTSIGKPLGEWP